MLGILILFSSVSSSSFTNDQDRSTRNRSNSTLHLSIKPGVLGTGFGLNAEYRVDSDTSLGMHTSYDGSLIGGWSTSGVHAKEYFGNSFFVQMNLVHVSLAARTTIHEGAGVGLLIGNEWQHASGLTTGVDWVGATAYYPDQEKKRHTAPLYPKLRLGFSL